jgi:serine/threonine-protein kinase RsbT
LTTLHSTYQTVLATLERYLSGMNARALLHQAIKEANGSLTNPRPGDLAQVGASLCRSLAIFVKAELRERAAEEVMATCGITEKPNRTARIEIRLEPDIAKARSEARRICESFGSSGYTIQRITTIVSELARNIVSYTNGGTIELNARTDGVARMHLIARDTGKGISNLEEIFSGTYRSRTGLGKGIAGCKRLADAFHLETNSSGTCIEIEVRF